MAETYNGAPCRRCGNRERYCSNRHCVPCKLRPDLGRGRRLEREFGITVEQYDQMLTQQGGTCAICHRPPSKKQRLAVDHNHKTGKVRGLLCGRCNRAIGAFHDDVERILAAARYVRATG